MKSLSQHITEKLVLNNNTKIKKHPEYKFKPESTKELKQLVRRLIEERGNDADLNDIDTSLITDMSILFSNFNYFPQNLFHHNPNIQKTYHIPDDHKGAN